MFDRMIEDNREPEVRKAAIYCDWCGEYLYEGQDYYEIDNEDLCCECGEKWLKEHKKEVEVNE